MAQASDGTKARVALGVILLLATALRVSDFPSQYHIRDMDERPYTQGGLMLLEGITPPYSWGPTGPQSWIVWTYAGVASGWNFWQLKGSPIEVRPFLAVDQALFDLYRDWSGPRRAVIIANIFVAILGTLAAFGVGLRRGGLAAAILTGGLAAALPIFVEYSDQAHPYAMAWGLMFVALYFADRSGRHRLLAAVFFGLSVSSRIDMLVLFPVAWADVWTEPAFSRSPCSKQPATDYAIKGTAD